MASTQSTEQILKSDVQGRVRVAPARREELVDEFERSGVSAARFASMVGVKYPTFAAWVLARRKKRQSAAVAPTGGPVRFLEAVMERGSSIAKSVPLEIELPGGARLRLTDVGQIPLALALLRSLNAPAAC
jgi:hypothetical protein